MHPGIVRHILNPLLERVLGRRTFSHFAHLQESQWWPADQLRELQARKLRRLLNNAHRHCPFYRQLFEKHGINPSGDPLEALRQLPPLDKHTIRAHLEEMTFRGVPGGPLPFNTGGSTGEPLVFYVDRERVAADKAARMLTHEWFGAHPGEHEVYLWGAPIELRAQDRLKRLRDWATNELLLSAFDLSPASMTLYLQRIREYAPASVFGYPSSLVALAEHGTSIGFKLNEAQPRAVFTTGEVLDDRQRDALAVFFEAPVANGYGSRDGGFIAHECPAGGMHVFDQNLIVEILGTDGQPVEVGECGEIVLTHLELRAMPLIRYRTGDLAARDPEPCACGRKMSRLGEIRGRRTDHLVSPNGALQHGLSAIYVIREIPTVRQFQIHQHRDRSLTVRIVPEVGFDATEAERIRRGLICHLGAKTAVSISLVNQIETQASGKFRHVISDAVDMGRSQNNSIPPVEIAT